MLDKRDKSKEKYPDMPYLETEEEAAENIADIYERRSNAREKEKKRTDAPDLESKEDDISEESEEREESEESVESEESEKIEYKKIDMDSINYLYEDISNRSFDFVTIDGNKYNIIKVINFLKNIKDGLYNDNNITDFFKKDGIDKIKLALDSAKNKSNFINEFITYINTLDSILFTPISSLEEEENTRSRIRTDQAKSFKDQKGSGYVNLPILLSEIYTNNSSKEFISNIEQLINNL